MSIDELEQRIENIVQALKEDLTERNGLGNEWNMIEEDIQEEILEEWRNILRAKLVERLSN